MLSVISARVSLLDNNIIYIFKRKSNRQFFSGKILSLEMIRKFEYELAKSGLSPDTVYNYKTAIGRFPNPISKESVQDYIVNLLHAKKKSAGYINFQIRVFRSFAKVVDLPWADDISYVKGGTEYEKKVIPLDVLQQILNFDMSRIKGNTKQPYLWNMCTAAMWIITLTGCRPSEALKLTRDDYDSATRTLSFRRTKTKNTRTIPIDPMLCDVLDEYVKTCVFDNLFFDPKYGRILLARQLLKNFDRRLKYLGYKKTRGVDVYSLRHTYISVMGSTKGGNISLRELQHLVGHKKLSTTERYLHVDTESLRMAVSLHPMAKDNQTLQQVFSEATNWFLSFFSRFNPHVVVKDYDDSDTKETVITFQVKIKKK